MDAKGETVDTDKNGFGSRKKYLADLFFRPPFNLGNKSKQLWEKAQPSVRSLPPILYRAINGVGKQERGV